MSSVERCRSLEEYLERHRLRGEGNRCVSGRNIKHEEQGGDEVGGESAVRSLEKDFVTLNKNMKPIGHKRKREPLYYVYTRFGDKKPLPDDRFLRQRRGYNHYKRKGKQRSSIDVHYDPDSDALQPSANKLKSVSPMHRHDIVCGLKANWSCLNMQYQKLPIINDTRWRQQRRADLERRLTQLEQDIQLMEMCKHLYTA